MDVSVGALVGLWVCNLRCASAFSSSSFADAALMSGGPEKREEMKVVGCCLGGREERADLDGGGLAGRLFCGSEISSVTD